MHVGGKNTIWRFMKSEGWRPLRRQKKPLLTAKQRAARLKFAKQYKNLTKKYGMIFFFRTNFPNICFSCPIQKMILFGVLRRTKFLQHIMFKKFKMNHGGGMTGRGLTGIHFLPQRQTLKANYYINNILEKEVKPVLHRKNVNEATDQRKLFNSNRHMTFDRPRRAPAHVAKATQAWCKKKNLPNFIEKTCWPPNSPNINPVENLWSMDEVVYKDPTPKTMKDLKRRLKQALSTLPDLTHSMLQRLLPNVMKNKGQRRACRKLTFPTYVLSKAINVLKKFHAEV